MGDDFFVLTPKLKARKAKINMLDYVKLKRFCPAKGTMNKMKRQPTKWDTIDENHIYDKRLISKIYNVLK